MKICPSCQRTHPDEMAFCSHDATPLQVYVAPTPGGQLLDGRYEIEELIAETRLGQLYRARDVRLGIRVAVKMFRPELRNEIIRWMERVPHVWRDALRFRHANVVVIYELNLNFMVMEYAGGESLDNELRRRGRIPPREVAELLAPVARALDAARAHGLPCDFLTPADIMIARVEDNCLFVKLLPLIFNRRFVDDRLRNTGEPVKSGLSGAEEIAAPYVAQRLSDDDTPRGEERSDVYSLGVISYELMSGRKPFDGLTPDEIKRKHATAEPAPLAELAPETPDAAVRAVERALAKRGKEHHATAGEFISQLQAALGVERGEIYSSPLKMAVTDDEASDEHQRGILIKTKSRDTSAESVDASITDTPLYADENVQFTVYQPETIAPARWHTLLAFAHLSKRRPDAPPDEPEPLAEVKRLAARVLADETAEYDALKQNSLHAVPRQGEITFVPDVDGCEFNPPSQTFSWHKSVHKVEFELRAAASLDGRVARGRLTVFLGTLILADVPLAIRVDSAASLSATRDAPAVVPASAAPYRKIFPSYSHKDRAVVEQIEHHVHALGDKYLRDVAELRAGQDWQRWMRDAIREADVFQLFWSHNSMRSVYVRQEWEYALSLGRANFVRPTYWEVPLPESPAENLPPQELRQLHFQHLRANTIADHPTSAVAHDEQASSELYKQAATKWHNRPATEAASAQPAGVDVVCARCGGRNLPEKAFCQTCGSALSATAQQPAIQAGAAQSSVPPAQSAAPEVSNALDIFWEKRPREAEQNLPPPQSYSQQSYPQMSYSPSSSGCTPRGRSTGLFILLFVVALLFALAVGVYLLVRLL
ncbi:MAG: hypothetical protein QOD32_1060 [Pyrinomonadaceae bacterium]|jgi:serine/threonine protein kinase|nr:hypothetical protein [Pyrinomonadaceae bacterium]